jgi:hypothetical protein
MGLAKIPNKHVFFFESTPKVYHILLEGKRFEYKNTTTSCEQGGGSLKDNEKNINSRQICITSSLLTTKRLHINN